MSATKIDYDKLNLQEMQYKVPVHWRLGGVEGDRYQALSRLLAETICQMTPVAQRKKVYVIDLGCGDGAGTWQMFNHLKDSGIDVRMHGSDYSEMAIKWAREMTKEYQTDCLEFKVTSAEVSEQIALEGYPLIVVMREVIEHLTEDQFADVVKGLTKHYSSGCLIVTTPTVNSPTEDKHYRHYDGNLINKWLADNRLVRESVFGFGFRPRILFRILVRLKAAFNRRQGLWRLMSPLWRKVPLSIAQTVVAVGSWSANNRNNP